MGKAPSNRLRVFRADKRVSQMVLATKTGVAVHNIWKIENGYRDATPEERRAFAAFFKVSIDEIFPTSQAAPAQQKRAAR